MATTEKKGGISTGTKNAFKIGLAIFVVVVVSYALYVVTTSVREKFEGNFGA